MLIRRLFLRNFRGASDASIAVHHVIDRKIITLIGLNESGKTTLLEGISYFPSTDVLAASVIKSRETDREISSFVPMHQAGVFTGTVATGGDFILAEEDRIDLVQMASEAGFEVDIERIPTSVTVSREFSFEGGDYIPSPFGSSWSGVDLYVRKSKKKKFELAEYPGGDVENRNDFLWVKAVNLLRARLPNVVYFPNFIADIPKRIYINKYKGEGVVNNYYRRIIEQIMEANGLSLTTNVLERINKFRKDDASWINGLYASGEKDKIDAVFLRLSKIITDEVLGSWGRVFSRALAAIRVDVKWLIDPDNEQPYIEVKITDGNSSYYLHQRSLGFRWFFSFLLFTIFGRDSSKQNLFLFDEPAANLHARAQTELLETFQRLADGGDIVIYSTHSHHMIKPEWLSGAYIVENEAINYEDQDDGAVNGADTNIKATPYRRFVGENGSRVGYYQPVIDRLDYVEPAVVPSGKQILVEGPSDFYAFRYALLKSSIKGKISIVPGTGSGSLDTLISIALARGNQFIVLLDDDQAGRKSAERYRRIFHLSEKEVCTLADADVNRSGARLEELLSDDTKGLIAEAYGNADKKTVGRYLAEAVASNTEGYLSETTLKSLTNILTAISARIGVQ